MFPSLSKELIVLGSLARVSTDRTCTHATLRPVQALGGDGFRPVIEDWPSPLGASTATTINGKVAIASQDTVFFGRSVIRNLSDVHELSTDGTDVWIPNTGANEALCMGKHPEETSRISFGPNYVHGNQIYRCVRGDQWILAHHVHGRQTLRRIKGHLLKSHGDGGLLSVDLKQRIDLKLAAPHSARRVNGENWIQDSGRARICRYAPNWDYLGDLSVGGWGRGAALTPDGQHLLVGLSPLRRRYKSEHVGPSVEGPEICVIDVETHSIVDRIPVHGIDQINGLLLADEAAVRAAIPVSVVDRSRA